MGKVGKGEESVGRSGTGASFKELTGCRNSHFQPLPCLRDSKRCCHLKSYILQDIK